MSNKPQIDALKAERQRHLDRAKELNRDIKALERAAEIAARVAGAAPAPVAPTGDPEATIAIPSDSPAAATVADLNPEMVGQGATPPPPPAAPALPPLPGQQLGE